jgi:hypothetical protein
MWMAGGDAAVLLPVLTLKGERILRNGRPARRPAFGDVIQAERQTGEWVFIGGYRARW